MFFSLVLTGIIFAFLWFNLYTLLWMIVYWEIFSLFLYIEWLNSELDMYVVTNNRIIWVDQISFLNRTVTECNLGQVQEVNSSTKWLFANILNYWQISIQTAWSLTTLSMWFAPNALQTSRQILNVVDDYRDQNPVKIEKVTSESRTKETEDTMKYWIPRSE